MLLECLKPSVVPVRICSTAVCAPEIPTAGHARRSNIAASAHRNSYVMSMCDRMKDANVFAKNTVLVLRKYGREV
jgi:hypothetical protein